MRWSPSILLVVMLGWVGIGGVAFLLSSVRTFEEWRADHGHGTPGVYTLTEQRDCSHDPRPEDRTCTWLGRFVSDDGTVVLSDVPLVLEGADRQVGDAVRVVDREFSGQQVLYLGDDPDGWRQNLVFVVPSGVALLVGSVGLVVILRPWQWPARWRRRRQPV